MSLQIKGKPQPLVTLVSVLAIGIIIGLSVRSIGYFWVMLVPNIFLLVLTIFLLIAYFERPERTARQPAHYPSLSVIIPSYNSKSTIFRTIDTIRASDYPGEKEIIVVDDGSSDGSRELLAKTEGIRVILQEKNGGKAKALNTAIPHTKGEFVACVDSDSYPEPDVFRHMADTLMHDDRGHMLHPRGEAPLAAGEAPGHGIPHRIRVRPDGHPLHEHNIRHARAVHSLPEEDAG